MYGTAVPVVMKILRSTQVMTWKAILQSLRYPQAERKSHEPRYENACTKAVQDDLTGIPSSVVAWYDCLDGVVNNAIFKG